MVNTKNEHIFPRDGGWRVGHEGTKKTFRVFENKEDAMEYAGIIALDEGGPDFKNGNELYVRKHKAAQIINGTIEIKHPIVNNTEPIVETMTSI